jgi:hypothetical protein
MYEISKDEEMMMIRRNAHLLILQIHALDEGESAEMEFDEFTIEFGNSLWSDDTYNSKEEELLLYFCIIYYNELYKCNDLIVNAISF